MEYKILIYVARRCEEIRCEEVNIHRRSPMAYKILIVKKSIGGVTIHETHAQSHSVSVHKSERFPGEIKFY
jgi:hypothetical protein